MLVVAEVVGMPAQSAVVIVLIVDVVTLMLPLRLALESFAQVHLRLEVVVRPAPVKQAMILTMVVVVEHAVSGRIRPRRAVGRRRIGVRLEKTTAVIDGRARSVVLLLQLASRV